ADCWARIRSTVSHRCSSVSGSSSIDMPLHKSAGKPVSGGGAKNWASSYRLTAGKESHNVGEHKNALRCCRVDDPGTWIDGLPNRAGLSGNLQVLGSARNPR